MLAAAVVGAIVLVAQVGDAQPVPRPNNSLQTQAFTNVRPGDPLAGLDAKQLASFTAELEEFTSVETADDGLGPIFNGMSCAQCHPVPGTIGSSTITVTRFGRVVNGAFDPLTELGGSLLQKFAIDPAVQEVGPKEANVATCHTPSMQAGPSPIAAIDRKTVGLYSDRLLHDMGRLGDGIAQGTAGMRDMKTAPLWGLRLRQPYLHDGRATTIDEAIRGHDGEAQVARDRYQRLSPVNRQKPARLPEDPVDAMVASEYLSWRMRVGRARRSVDVALPRYFVLTGAGSASSPSNACV